MAKSTINNKAFDVRDSMTIVLKDAWVPKVVREDIVRTNLGTDKAK